MRFQPFSARPHWRDLAQRLGYLAGLFDNPPYWIEAVKQPFCAVFSDSEITETIERATRDLYDMSLRAASHVCESADSEKLLHRLRIPKEFHDVVRLSWKRGDPSIYGRFDFAYVDGTLKLLELNFDGAVSLYEAAVFQWLWLEDLRKDGAFADNASQFNIINDRLIRAFHGLNLGEAEIIHFASLDDSPEDEGTVKYMQSCATLANIGTQFIYVKDLGYDDEGRLVDLNSRVITNLFKLYPWEMLFQEDSVLAKDLGHSVLIPLLASNQTRFIEPIWKCILANKGILSLLWEMEPDCRWLLETAFEEDARASDIQKSEHVRKPIFGREGRSVAVVYPDAPERTLVNPGHYGDEGFVVQRLQPLATHDGFHLVIGSWIVNGEPCGLGLRADKSPITTATNCLFVPHCILDTAD